MVSMLLILPAELKLQIAESLIPLATASSIYTCDNARTLADDVESLSTSFQDLRNLSVTCTVMREVCRGLVAKGVNIHGEDGQASLLNVLDDSTPAMDVRDARKTRFLILRSPGYCDNCREHNFFQPHGHVVAIERVFQNFSSVTTLDLVNFPFNLATISALQPLKALRTLSVREPDARENVPIHFLHQKKAAWSLPQVTNLSVVISDFEAGEAACNVLRFFDNNLIVLSIKSIENNGTRYLRTQNFLGSNALYLGNAAFIDVKNLRHLSIGYLNFTSRSLREAIANNCKNLESLAVDCRGMADGMLPLYYVIDLVRSVVGDDQGLIDMLAYEWVQEGWDQDPEMAFGDTIAPYSTDAKIWRRLVQNLFCTICHHGPDASSIRTVKGFELVFAPLDKDSEHINEDIKFGELSDVFRRRSSTFQHLETLFIAMSSVEHFESWESKEELKTTVLQISTSVLASVRKFNVDWGRYKLRLSRTSEESPEVVIYDKDADV